LRGSRRAGLFNRLPRPVLGLAFERRASLPGPRRDVAHKRRERPAEGKTPKEVLRALKRQISDAIFACLQADARRAAAAAANSPGGQPGNGSASSAAGSHPEHRLFGQATAGSATHPTTPAAPFPCRCHPVRAGGRVQDRAQPGRAAAPAGRPRRGRPRADNALQRERTARREPTLSHRGGHPQDDVDGGTAALPGGPASAPGSDCPSASRT
jgi:hypothetical protein